MADQVPFPNQLASRGGSPVRQASGRRAESSPTSTLKAGPLATSPQSLYPSFSLCAMKQVGNHPNMGHLGQLVWTIR